MKLPFTRPIFDDALASIASQLPSEFTPAHASLLWDSLRVAISARNAALTLRLQKRADLPKRMHWSKEAIALREPLRIEVTANSHRLKTRAFEPRYSGISITLPDPKGGRNRAPIAVDVMAAFRLYCTSLEDILQRMDAALRAGGHWDTHDTMHENYTCPQPLDVIVANERAAGRPAGTLDWTQWEKPGRMRQLCAIFEQAREMTSKRGRSWIPYAILGRGAANTSRLMGAWHRAFDDAVHAYDDVHAAATQALTIPAYPLDRRTPEQQCTIRMASFYALLRTLATTRAIDAAIKRECTAHRGPNNARFTRRSASSPTRCIWHALDMQTRASLAAHFHAAVTDCYELLTNARHPKAPEYSPAVMPNLWELTEEERAKPELVRVAVVDSSQPTTAQQEAAELAAYELPTPDFKAWED
jgi:hypothetical protein